MASLAPVRAIDADGDDVEAIFEMERGGHLVLVCCRVTGYARLVLALVDEDPDPKDATWDHPDEWPYRDMEWDYPEPTEH